ncbi:MAG: cation diffusion facilitator family transporter [Prevotella sp.]
MTKTYNDRERTIYKVTLFGSCVNVLLVAIKFVFGVVGCSAAMIADAVHSMSDLITDVVVIIFVKLSNKPQDEDHDYGHGKYETLATSLVGLALLFVGVMILYSGAENIYRAMNGELLRQPGLVALFAAVISVVLKEWAYRFTIRTGRKVNSQAVIANAWHHRSDAFSSIGTSLGIGGAIFLGSKWVVLDPIAAVIVSLFIIKTACVLIKKAFDELLEKSLPAEIEAEIMSIAEQETDVSGIHNLRTRRIGNHIAMEMHLRMPGETSLYTAHQHTREIEKRLREHFGANTLINIHVEPLKVSGRYVAPDNDSTPTVH